MSLWMRRSLLNTTALCNISSRKVFFCSPLLLGTSSLQLLTRHFHLSSHTFKDKSFKDSPAGPRKSKFQSTSTEAAPTKIRSDEEKKKLAEERKQREEKKQAIRAKQLEIQAKRDAGKDAKKVKQVATKEKEKSE